jgi:hypothetical protein
MKLIVRMGWPVRSGRRLLHNQQFKVGQHRAWYVAYKARMSVG